MRRVVSTIGLDSYLDLANQVILANRIRKRMVCLLVFFFLPILPQFYRFSNSHINLRLP